MKKFNKGAIKFIGVYLLLLSCTLLSCSTESSFNQSLIDKSESTIITRLKTVNAEIYANTSISPTSRGWNEWSNSKRAYVVTKDFIGAYVGGKAGARWGARIGAVSGQPITGSVFGAFLGGAISGGYSSWLARKEYQDLEDINNPSDEVGEEDIEEIDEEECFDSIANICKYLVINGVFIEDENEEEVDGVIDRMLTSGIQVEDEYIATSKLDRRSIIIGKMHNALLGSIDGRAANNTSTRRLSSNSGGNNDSDIDPELQLQEDIANSVDFLADCKQTAYTVNDDNVDLAEDTPYNILSLFIEVLENYSTQSANVAFVIGKYTEIIDQSEELTDDEKRDLKASLATALYSSRYWEDLR